MNRPISNWLLEMLQRWTFQCPRVLCFSSFFRIYLQFFLFHFHSKNMLWHFRWELKWLSLEIHGLEQDFRLGPEVAELYVQYKSSINAKLSVELTERENRLQSNFNLNEESQSKTQKEMNTEIHWEMPAKPWARKYRRIICQQGCMMNEERKPGKKYHLNSNKRMKIWKNSWVIVCRTSVCCDAEWIRNVFDIKWTFYNMLCVMFIAAKSCVEHLLCVTGWWSGRKWTRAIERWKMGRTEQERRRKSGCRGVWSIKCSMLYMFDDVFTFCMRVSMQKAKHEPNI